MQYKRLTNSEMKERVLIIGGGIGGLVCGAILAKEGYQVRILEKHTTIGGGLHTFKRHGVEFETGMHVISGFEDTGVLRRFFSYLGIMDKLRIKSADTCGFDHFHIVSDNRTYKLAIGRDNFVRTLSGYFPEERENISRYVEKIYEIADSIELFNLKIPSQGVHTKLEMVSVSVNEFIASFTQNEKLQALLAWNNGLYGGQKDCTPAYIGALITKFYIEGASRFVGGSQQLADAMAEAILQNYGEIITGNGVTWIDVQDKQIRKVVTENGREYTADWYISAIHTSTMFRLMDVSKIQKSYYHRIDSIPNSYSTFLLFIKFKPNQFPYLNYTTYSLPDYSKTWEIGNYDEGNWPCGIMYITPPVTENDAFAEKMIVNTIMRFDTVKKWEHTTIGRRGEDYIAFKKECEERILDWLEKKYEGFREKIDKTFSATPLTIRDYYGAKEGAIYGTIQDCRNMAATNIAIRTKVNNLLLTGQNINLHGILGVPLTAISTCGELIGMEKLLNKINQYESKREEIDYEAETDLPQMGKVARTNHF